MDGVYYLESPLLMIRCALVILLLLLVSVLVVLSQNRSRHRYPPGPFAWPIIGNLATVAKRPTEMYEVVNDLRAVHGDVFSLYFGNKLTVFINSYSLIKKAMVGHGNVFSVRPKSAMKVWGKLFKRKGLGMLHGKDLEAVKRATKSALRKLTFGSELLDKRMEIEASTVVDYLHKTHAQPFSIDEIALKSFANVMCAITLGKRFEYDDELFKQLIHLVFKFLHNLPIDALENFIPLLGLVNPTSTSKMLMKTLQDTEDIITGFIEDHKKTFDSSNIRDFIDAFLCLRQEQPQSELFSDDNLKTMIHSLFMAGMESTQTCLKWFCLYMIHYPEVQAACQAEVDQVIGKNRYPSVSDKGKMPFMLATIYELLRHCNIAPLAAPHATSEDIIFEGYFIPKDCIVFFNFHSVHMDPDLWLNPTKFYPKRWFDDNGKLVKSMDGFLPFSIGPRYCLGDNLAKRELFLMFVSLLQNFDLRAPRGGSVPSLRGIQRLSLGPQPFMMTAVPR